MEENIFKKVSFETLKLNVGEVNFKEKLILKSKCTQGRDMLHYTYTNSSCPCVKPKLTEDGIEIDFSVHGLVGDVPKGETKVISRYVFIKLNSEEREFVANKEGTRVINPKNRIIRFHISGTATN